MIIEQQEIDLQNYGFTIYRLNSLVRRLKPSAIHDSTEDIGKRAEARETFLPEFVTGIADGKEARDAHYKTRLRDASEGRAGDLLRRTLSCR